MTFLRVICKWTTCSTLTRFLWFGSDDTRVPAGVTAAITDPENNVGISVASFWEIGIKATIGNLSLPTSLLGLEAQAAGLDIVIVPITVAVIHQTTVMPLHHKDPFDRIIGATALSMGAVLISADTVFDEYAVPRLWA